MKAISLFAGAGGLDLGCEAAGFRTVAIVESEAAARSTIEANRERWLPELDPAAMLEDILESNPDDLLERVELHAGELDLVHGGPPCTPFSKSGYWLAYKRAGKDPKASLLDSFAEVVEVTRPKAFLMENVYGLAYQNQNRRVLKRFVDRIVAAGYSFDHNVMLAADFGVPQLRQRLVCVGFRDDILDLPAPFWPFWRFRWPTPTHSGPHETRTGWDESLPPHRTAGEAFAGLTEELNPREPEEVVTGTYEEELRAVPPGDNYLFWTTKRGHPTPRFKWRSRYWSFLLKLAPDRPSPTIQGQPGPWVGPFHWESRRLRVPELKRLMAFPDEYVILGSRREQQLQLGNAVPPALGQVVAQSIRDELLRLSAVEPAELAA